MSEEVRFKLWEQPVLHTDQPGHTERKVSWLELLYDLVFVVVIAQLSHSLAKHLDPVGVAQVVLLFLPAWWMWVSGTVYNERFETHDLSYRLLVLLQMLVVAALAIFSGGALGKTSQGFALAYAAGRALVIFMWARGGWYNPQARPLTSRYVTGFSISVLLWVLSVWVPTPWRFVLWAVGLSIDVATPLLTIKQQRLLPRYSSSKLPERMGLFVLIVLGESIVSIVTGLSTDLSHLSLALGLKLALGMGVIFGIWWVYFDFVSRRPPRPTPQASIAWTHLHFLLLISLIIISAVNVNILGGAHGISQKLHWELSGAFALSLASMGALQLMLAVPAGEQRQFRQTAFAKFLAALVVLGVTALLPDADAVVLYALYLVCLSLVIAHGVWRIHFSRALSDEFPLQEEA